MSDPRMRPRPKGQQFPTSDSQVLVAYGDDAQPLSETVKLLDELITDFVIETCTEAAAVAHHANRAKVKVDDVKFVFRRDPEKLGRVEALIDADRDIRSNRKAFAADDAAAAAKDAAAKAAAAANAARGSADDASESLLDAPLEPDAGRGADAVDVDASPGAAGLPDDGKG